MANITALRAFALPAAAGELQIVGDSQFRILDSGGRISFFGQYEISNGAVVAGMTTSVSFVETLENGKSSKLASINRIDGADAAQLWDFIELGDWDGAWELVLAGDDAFTGSSGDDAFLGYAGNDVLLGAGGNDTLEGGDGEDQITGGALNDMLSGGDGNDTLNGGTGRDSMDGGDGDDAYYVDRTLDLVAEQSDGGVDTVFARASFELGANIENLYLQGTRNLWGMGNELGNLISGNGGDNVLSGMDGDDTLQGGGGADVLIGGLGDDVYLADAADTLTELFDEGTDTVVAQGNHRLGDNFENLVLGGNGDTKGTGNELANWLTGNSGNNLLSGLAGDDTLNGAGGSDTLRGGTGDDTYVVDQSGAQVAEKAGEGTDQVMASISFALAANVENLVLTGEADIDGTGNALDNVISGNAGANVIDGGGGSDTVSYATLETKVAVNLYTGTAKDYDANTTDTLVSIENVTTGSADDHLIGDDGNNVLDGGEGADTMVGGRGDDTFIVDDEGDVATEWHRDGRAGEGHDTVMSSVSWSLDPAIEDLILTGEDDIEGHGTSKNSVGDHNNLIVGNSGDNELTGYGAGAEAELGSGTDTIFGGAGDDFIDGGDQADRLSGDAGDDTLIGGLGRDFLTGGEGNDDFVFEDFNNIDVITDFDVADDQIVLDVAAFEALEAFQGGESGHWLSENFNWSDGVQSEFDFVLYDFSTGALYYDEDANGAGAAVQFAQLDPGLYLSDANFILT